MALDDPVLPVHGDAGEVAHVLVGAGELVEQGGLARVLVAHQSEGQRGARRQRVTVPLGVIPAALPQARVLAFFNGGDAPVGIGPLLDGLDLNLGSVGHPDGQLVPMDLELHGIPHGGQLHHGDLRAGDHAHVQKMLPQGPFPAHGADHGGFAHQKLVQRHAIASFPPRFAKANFLGEVYSFFGEKAIDLVKYTGIWYAECGGAA